MYIQICIKFTSIFDILYVQSFYCYTQVRYDFIMHNINTDDDPKVIY